MVVAPGTAGRTNAGQAAEPEQASVTRQPANTAAVCSVLPPDPTFPQRLGPRAEVGMGCSGGALEGRGWVPPLPCPALALLLHSPLSLQSLGRGDRPWEGAEAGGAGDWTRLRKARRGSGLLLGVPASRPPGRASASNRRASLSGGAPASPEPSHRDQPCKSGPLCLPASPEAKRIPQHVLGGQGWILSFRKWGSGVAVPPAQRLPGVLSASPRASQRPRCGPFPPPARSLGLLKVKCERRPLPVGRLGTARAGRDALHPAAERASIRAALTASAPEHKDLGDRMESPAPPSLMSPPLQRPFALRPHPQVLRIRAWTSWGGAFPCLPWKPTKSEVVPAGLAPPGPGGCQE